MADRRAAAQADLEAERATGIGGSDAHHLDSIEPWGCARRLVYEKRGAPPDFPLKGLQLERGRRLEAIAAELYSEQTGRALRRLSVRRRRDAPYLLVHADREILNDARGPGILEVKAVDRFVFQKYQRDGLPPAYLLQLQWALLVTGRTWGAFAVFWPDGFELLSFDMDRNDDVVARLLEGAHRLWRQVENGPLPSQLPEGDKRCTTCPWRLTCLGPAAERLVPAGDRDVELVPLEDPELVQMLADFDEAKAIAKQASDVEDAIAAAIKAKLGDVQAALVGGRRVFYRQQTGSVILDADTLKKHAKPRFLEWLYRRFGKPKKGARPLRIY